MRREAGVLLHITSLPGPYGIGKLGRNAADFAKLLADTGFSWWQVLPFGPPAAGYSPYQCYSAFAGNPMLIDPDWLLEHKLITSAEQEDCRYHGSAHGCDFVWLEKTTETMLRRAYARCSLDMLEQVQEYAARQQHWLPDHAVYMTLRIENGNQPWWLWSDQKLRAHDNETLAYYTAERQAEINYHCFVQYIFDQQWHETRAMIHEYDIRLIGDLPIYVSLDSSDVWGNTGLFELDSDLLPLRVAGVPPDYFSEDGQLWGNPLYDWPVHRSQEFRWWRQRIGQSLQWFDRLRLDHFRGFSAYWAVEANAENARVGEWLQGPGASIFHYLFSDYGHDVFIAEDLGEIDAAVYELLDELKLPGMRVLQFGFDPDSDSHHLPCFYPEDSIAFTGTHDNNTLLGWLWEIDDRQRQFALEYCGFEGSSIDWGRGGTDAPVIRALIRLVWSSASALAIVPVQDLLGYGSDTRMNMPGIGSGQWRYRLTSDDLAKIDRSWVNNLNKTYRRARKNKPAEVN